jgi:tripartite-type tricarboxylate transporter receptor subunit TctC
MRKALMHAAILCCAASAPAELLAADDYYRGKQINMIVAFAPGTGFDAFGRLIASYMPKYIPGSPTIVVQNMPGAGGLIATNWLYNIAPKDGLTIGLTDTNVAFNPLYGDEQARFVADKFNWLGSPSKEIGLLVVWHTVPVNTLEEAGNRQFLIGATGAGSTPAFFARVLASVLDLNFKLITGYKSQQESFLAMERGENDGNASPFWSSLKSQYPSWITEKKIKVLTYYGPERAPEIPGPYVFDLITDPEKKRMMEIAQAGLGMGRPLVAPPDVDPQRVAILRAALYSVFQDSAYLAECAKAKLDCSSPSSGEDLLALVRRVYAQPKSAIDQVTAIYWQGQQR